MAATTEQWAMARKKFETTGVSGAKIADSIGVSRAALSKMAGRHGWVKYNANGVDKKVDSVDKVQVDKVDTPTINQKVVQLNSKGKPLQRTGPVVRALVVEANKQMNEYNSTHNPEKWKAWCNGPDAMNEFSDFIATNGVEGSLMEFCRQREFGISTLHRWISAEPLRMEEYTRAKKGRADTLFDTLLGISTKEPERGPDGKIDPGWVQWQRLIVDTAKWGVAKLKPETYGERTDLHISGNITQTLDKDTLMAELAKLTRKGARVPLLTDVTDVEPKA